LGAVQPEAKLPSQGEAKTPSSPPADLQVAKARFHDGQARKPCLSSRQKSMILIDLLSSGLRTRLAPGCAGTVSTY
jgi:hypothetical protein